MTDVKAETSRAKPAQRKSAGTPPPAAAPESPAADLGSQDQLKALQEMSANLARAAMIAQGAVDCHRFM